MNTKLLEQIGLTTEQSSVYYCLVSLGTIQARKIAKESKINRSLVYKILKQLIEIGLAVENVIPGSINTFTAQHPSRLNEIVRKKEGELKIAEMSLHETMGELGALFNLNQDKPAIYFYEGLDGIRFLNKDILLTKMNIRLIRSPLDNNTDELNNHTRRNIEERAYIGINTKLIVPIKNTQSTILPEWDKKHLIERVRVPRDELNNPAQVVIYGSKVAITSFKDSMITTVINDKSIAETFTMMFDSIWAKYINRQ